MHRLRIRPCEQRTFSRARAVHNKAAPAFFYERLARRMALFLPVIDAAPVHDHWGGKFFWQAKMTDDCLALKWNRNALDRDVKIFRRGEKHLPGLCIAMMFTRRAWKGMTRNAVVSIGFEERLFSLGAISRFLSSFGSFFPARPKVVPSGGPTFAVEVRHFCQRFFRLALVRVEKWRAVADPATDIIFHFFKGAWFAHGSVLSQIDRPVMTLTLNRH